MEKQNYDLCEALYQKIVLFPKTVFLASLILIVVTINFLPTLKKTINHQLQGALLLDQTTLSPGLKPLISGGYIVVKEGTDRRQKEFLLTKEGRALFSEAEALWLDAQNYVK